MQIRSSRLSLKKTSLPLWACSVSLKRLEYKVYGVPKEASDALWLSPPYKQHERTVLRGCLTYMDMCYYSSCIVGMFRSWCVFSVCLHCIVSSSTLFTLDNFTPHLYLMEMSWNNIIYCDVKK